MQPKVKIICTIGPTSNKPEILERLASRNIDFFRINLSHTEEEDIEKRIKDLLGYNIPIILDTEGSQIRSGNTSEIDYEEGVTIKIHGNRIDCNSENLFLNPVGVIARFRIGDLISIDFDSLLLRVFDVSTLKEGYIKCRVLIGGKIGGKKAVHIESPTFSLPPFSKKDNLAVELAKKYKINHFTLSFIESKDDVEKFRKNYPGVTLYSKIESKKGLNNFLEIAKVSDGILIDRGDLSDQVPLEKIPFVQKLVIKKVRELGKEVFVATNTLEQMSFSLKPNRAEVNDIVNTILDGATGIALTKETAVGKYPVETVNTLKTLIRQIEYLGNDRDKLINNIEKTNYAIRDDYPDMLVKPHGGKLIDRFDPNYKGPIPDKRVEIDEETLMDIEQIANGAFSPLEGFMNEKDFISVRDEMKLSNGVVWPLPIILPVTQDVKNRLTEGESVSLTYNDEVYAILHLEQIYSIDKNMAALKIYGTLDRDHPGVKRFMESGSYALAGKIGLIKMRESQTKIHELTPKQTRKIFAERGWSKIVGFHTRNVIHRSHEFVQIEALKKSLCDGLFIHPVIGKKKTGDFEAEVIMKTYEKMIEEFYPKSKVIFGTFATYSRYCGPREALFTALTRKNFGCSHFIVGRDHTGVGTFYDALASHKIFDKFSEEELGIIPIKFNKVFYSDLEKKHIHENDFSDHPEENKMHISGTEAREMLKAGKQPPEWFMRPEISSIIIEKVKKGEKVFVE